MNDFLAHCPIVFVHCAHMLLAPRTDPDPGQVEVGICWMKWP